MEILVFINEKIIWGPALVLLFLGTGFFLSIRLKFFQFFQIRRILQEFITGLFSKKKRKREVSPFQALATALAGTIGVGNIAGVATAITAGGAGAIFWMWVSSLFGMATKYTEIVLACKYRTKNKDGEQVGGPMYFLEKGLHSKPLAVLFSVCCMCAAVFGIGNMTQANTIANTVYDSFQVSHGLTGVVLMVSVGLVLLGGIGRISKVTALLVPVMGLFYIAGTFVVIGTNITSLPEAFARIFREAMGVRAMGGGVLGYGIMTSIRVGLSRGVFTNEAGLGSSTMAHAASGETNSVKQGFLGVVEVLFDTLIMCTLTALVILCSGVQDGVTDGIALTSRAFETVMGDYGGIFITISTTLFAFATLLGWSYYGELCAGYLAGSKSIKIPYRIMYISAIYLGCTMNLKSVWAVADISNGLMAIPNLIGILCLSGEVFLLTNRFFSKNRIK